MSEIYDLLDPVSNTAYIDMEFGAAYGSHNKINIPIEIGTVLYNPKSDELDFSGKKFHYDIEVEQWQNVTDELKRTIDVKVRTFNVGKPEIAILRSSKFHLDDAGKRNAIRISRSIHYNLNEYMQNLKKRDMRTVVFFANDRENFALKRAGFDTSNLVCRDLQKEIKEKFSLEQIMSLDRLSYVIKFRLSKNTIHSEHYSYKIPEKFQYLVKPHKAIGDAARMFILSKEFYHHADDLEENIKKYLALCENYAISSKKNQTFKDLH